MKEEIQNFLEIYAQAFQHNWGFVAPTPRESAHFASELKQILDPDFVLCCEVQGVRAACVVAVPDLNQVLKGTDGRLFPWGLIRFLFRRRLIDQGRLLLLGVLPEYQGLGLLPLLVHELAQRAAGRAYRRVEFSWVLEDNVDINQPAEQAAPALQDLPHLPEGALVTRTVAMTGATGFIGWHVARRFQTADGTFGRWFVRRAAAGPGRRRADQRRSDEADVISACTALARRPHGRRHGAPLDRRVRADERRRPRVQWRALPARWVSDSCTCRASALTGPRHLTIRPPKTIRRDRSTRTARASGAAKMSCRSLTASNGRSSGRRSCTVHAIGCSIPLFKMSRHGLFLVPERRQPSTTSSTWTMSREASRWLERPCVRARCSLSGILNTSAWSTCSRTWRRCSIGDFVRSPFRALGLERWPRSARLLSYAGFERRSIADRLKEIERRRVRLSDRQSARSSGIRRGDRTASGLASTAEWYARRDGSSNRSRLGHRII